MTDLPFRKVLGLNQQTYQRLKVALGLNLRRQIFVAVCDDFGLRDRMAAQLLSDLTYQSPSPQGEQLRPSPKNSQRYPRLVTLNLSLSNPNPIAHVAQWLAQFPPPKSGSQRSSIPAFQILGIEHLTRQPAAIQRQFFTHLQGVERSLPVLESSLLLWMPQPWFHALPQSAPEFWRCRTAVFEFAGDPTPLPAASNKPSGKQPQRQLDPNPPKSKSDEAVSEGARQPDSASQEDLWSILARDLARLDEGMEETPQPDEPKLNLLHSKAVTQQEPEGAASQSAVLTRPTTVSATVQPANSSTTGVVPAIASKTKIEVRPLTQAKTDLNSKAELPKTAVEPSLQDRPATEEPQLPYLLQQIDLLHQQQAPPAALADAYRALGNLYRDRIEQGDASPQNLMIAIQAYEQVLVWLHETSFLWTDVLNDLGNLYWMRSRSSDPQEVLRYLQQGIQAYQLALTKLNLQTQPYAYPMIQNNLGAAYADLARYQDPAENLQRSVQSYQQALRHRTPEVEPLKYASTQNNLGTTYWNLAQHQQPEVYLKQAIAAYSEALHYYRPDQEPLNYAMIQNNLGTAYWNLAQHERPQDWLRLALGAYQMALRFRTLEASPAAFAATQNNLGTAYWHLANQIKDDFGERSNYLLEAINAYEAALLAAQRLAESAQPTPLNFDLFATHNNLGLAHYQIATDLQTALETSVKSAHLEIALHHHLQALQGWQQKIEFRQTALSCVIQAVRALYNECGLSGQNLALSKIPSDLLPEILPQL